MFKEPIKSLSPNRKIKTIISGLISIHKEKGIRYSHMSKVVKFPVSYSQRIRNTMGKGYVPCEVSSRWLQFTENSGGFFSTGEYIGVNVMTLDQNEKPRKICNLILTREDLERALANVKPPINK